VSRFEIPNPVNEVSARLVASGVVLLAGSTVVFRQPLLMLPLTYGFLARVLAGPTFSPLGLFVTRIVTPRLGLRARYVPGPPKRFAQGMGAVVSGSAAVAYFALGWTGAAYGLLSLLVVAAGLEASIGFCLGCRIFAVLMRLGIVKADACAECSDIRNRTPMVA